MKSVAQRILERKTPSFGVTLERKHKRPTNVHNEMLETIPEHCRYWEKKITSYLIQRCLAEHFLLDVRVVAPVASDIIIVTGYLSILNKKDQTILDDYVIYKVEVVNEVITSIKTVDKIDVSRILKIGEKYAKL